MAPKTGPRGVTIEDVQNVADKGRAGYTITPRAPVTPVAPAPAPSTADLAFLLAGGAQPGYGQKYGGLGSTTNLTNAIKGNVYGTLIPLQQAMAAKVAAAQAPIEQQYAITSQTAPNMYGAMPSTTERDIGRQLIEMQNQDKIRALQNMIYSSVDWHGSRGFPTEKTTEPTTTPVDWYGSREFPGVGPNAEQRKNLFDFARQAQEAALQNQLRTEQNRAALERTAQTQDIIKQAQAAREAGYQKIVPMQQLASNLAAISPSEYAQLVATQQYGVPSAVAAGQFGPGFDAAVMAEQRRLESAQMPDFNKNAAQLAWEQGGDAGLQAYYDQQLTKAMGGTVEQQAAAQQALQDISNLQTDNAIYAQSGGAFTPNIIYPNNDQANAFRQYIVDNPAFIDSANQVVTDAADAVTSGADPQEVISAAYQQYYQATGDKVGANYIADIVAYFGA